MTPPTGRDRRVVAIAATAVVVLALGSATLALASTGWTGRSPSGAFAPDRCRVPTLPGRIVRVTLSDRGNHMMGTTPMMATLRVDPGSVRSGQISLVAYNRGVLAHELVVLPLPADGPGTRPVGADGKIDEAQSLGEASKSCHAGAGDGLAPSSTGWVTLTLPPGRYELVCDEPWHYAAGMFGVLTVI